MKTIFRIILPATLLLAACQSNTNESSTDKFNRMSSDDSFKKAHEAPVATSDTAVSGENMQLSIKDADPARGYFLRTAEPSKNYLLVFHEWWGLNPYIKSESEKYFRELKNVNVLALDLYDGKVATTQDDAQSLTQNTKEERIRQIISRAIAYCGPDAHIATLGWCYGGGWSLQAALMGGDKTVGCVMYYGMPEDDVNKLKKLHGPVLGIFGNKDAFITPEIVNQFEQKMKKAGKSLEVHRYDAVHAFANPSNPHHDKAATADAYQHSAAFLRSIYGQNNR